jgi:hypothetical protein
MTGSRREWREKSTLLYEFYPLTSSINPSPDLGGKLGTAKINPLIVFEKGRVVVAGDAVVAKADRNVDVSK